MSECGYIAFYQGKRIELHAASLYAAKLQAVKLFDVPKSKRGLISVMLKEKNGQPVIHSTASI